MVDRSQFVGVLGTAGLPADAEAPAAEDTAEQPEGRDSETPESAETPATPTQEDPRAAELAMLQKRLDDSQRFIKELLDERRAARSVEPAVPAKESALDRLTELGIPADTIREVVREISAEVVESRVGPAEKNAEANSYMAANHPEYVKALPKVLEFLATNKSANEDVMELVSSGKPKAAHLLAWASYLEATAATRPAAEADAAAVQAARNAAKARGTMVPAGQQQARPSGDGKKPSMQPAERLKKAQEIAERTGDKRALTIETARALWGDIVKDIAARPR